MTLAVMLPIESWWLSDGFIMEGCIRTAAGCWAKKEGNRLCCICCWGCWGWEKDGAC